jgi:hypothetical protein
LLIISYGYHFKARVRHLREIRVLLDAAVFRMDEYMRVAPTEGFTRLDHIRPTSTTNTNAESGDFQNAKDETPKTDGDTAQAQPFHKAQTSSTGESANVNQTGQNAASESTSNVQGFL